MKKYSHILFVFITFTCCTNLQAATPAEECMRLFDEGLSQQAISPCTQAAEDGDRPAQTMLGEIYDEAGNSEKTSFWWNKAADAGYQPARNLLAMKYYYGGSVFGPEKGWAQDYARAFNIWRQDAGQGIATSQFMVGVMYQKGQGVKQNLAVAWAWLQLALENGYKLSTDVLIELSREITPEQKRQGAKKLTEYRRQTSKIASDEIKHGNK